MSRNEDVTTGIWVDLMDLTTEAKLLYIWSFTNEHNGMAGLYKIHEAMISVETGLDSDRLRVALAELAEHAFMFYVDGVIWVRTRARRLRSRTPQIAKSIAKDVAAIKSEHPLVVRFLEVYGDEGWLREALKLNLARGSSEVHVNSDKQGRSVNLKRTSSEVPLSGPREGVRSTATSHGLEDDARALPAEFPAELEPHLDSVLKVLSDLAGRHEAKAVGRLSLASVLMAPDRRHKPLVRAAHDYAAWADGQAPRRKDVVSGYRNWLDKTNDLAGTERIGAPSNGATVRRLRDPALEKRDRFMTSAEYQEGA